MASIIFVLIVCQAGMKAETMATAHNIRKRNIQVDFMRGPTIGFPAQGQVSQAGSLCRGAANSLDLVPRT